MVRDAKSGPLTSLRWNAASRDYGLGCRVHGTNLICDYKACVNFGQRVPQLDEHGQNQRRSPSVANLGLCDEGPMGEGLVHNLSLSHGVWPRIVALIS